MAIVSGVSAALAGLKTASDLTTRLREAIGSRELKLDEAIARIIEIQCHISDTHTSLNAVQEQIHAKNIEIFELQQQNTKLNEKLAKKALGRKHDNAVWKVLEDGTEDGPYCPNCFETNGNFIQPRRGVANDEWALFNCNEHGGATFSFKVPPRLCGASAVKKREPSAKQPPTSFWSS